MESIAFLPKGNFSPGGWLHREEHLLENPVPTTSGPNCTQGQRRVLTKQLAAPDTLVAVRHSCCKRQGEASSYVIATRLFIVFLWGQI